MSELPGGVPPRGRTPPTGGGDYTPGSKPSVYDEQFEEVDITGDPELEAAYREWLPVVEIDGERAFVYFVDPAAFRRKLAAQS